MRQAVLTIALLPFVVLPAIADPGDETCFPLYRDTGATPGTSTCPTRAATASVGLGTYFCTGSGGPRGLRYCGVLTKDFNRECRIEHDD